MFLWVHGEAGRGVPIWFMVPIRFQILEVPPLHEPYPRSGVSAERRWLLFPRIAALCRDAATPGFMVPMCGWKTVGTTHDQVAADVSPRTLKYSGQTHVGSRVRPPHPFQPVGIAVECFAVHPLTCRNESGDLIRPGADQNRRGHEPPASARRSAD